MYGKLAAFFGFSLIAGIYGLFFYGILYHSILSTFGKVVVIWFWSTLTLFAIFHTAYLKKKGLID